MLRSPPIDARRNYVPFSGVTWSSRSSHFVIGGSERIAVGNRPLIDLLERMDGRTPLTGVIASIADEQDVPLQDVAASVLPVAQELLDRGIIVAGGQAAADRPVSRPRAKPQSNAHKFSHLFLEMTARCNLRCKHCYMEAGLARPNEVAAHDMIHLVDEFANLGGTFVTLSGGEPLMYRNWPIIAQYAADRGLRLSMMTNGTYLDEAVLATIRRLDIGVGLGLDGIRAETHDANRGKGSFAETVAALDLLVANGYQHNVTICFSALRFNVYDLPGIVEAMIARGLPRLYVSLMEDRGRAATFRERLELTEDQKVWLLRYLYQVSREFRNLLNVEVTHHVPIYQRLLGGDAADPEDDRSMTIRMESRGELYLSAYMGAADLMIGKIGDKPLEALLESDLASGIIAACSNRELRVPKCMRCVYKHLCKGGSAVLAYSKSGSFDEVDDFCEARIALFDWLAAEKIGLPTAMAGN
jgi:radical SAM protein with 4Fe4S-binding SPASM domain